MKHFLHKTLLMLVPLALMAFGYRMVFDTEPTWIIYSADVVPLDFDPAFTSSQGTAGAITEVIDDPEISGNKLLRKVTPTNGDNQQWRHNYTAGDPGPIHATVVFRAKAMDATANMVFDIDFDNGAYRAQFRVLTNGNYTLPNHGNEAGVPTSGSLGINPLEWNVYRFVISGANTFLYVNENPTPVYSGLAQGISGSQRYFRFGDGWGSGRIDTHFDWVVWDRAAAWSPTEGPLPSGLTGIGEPGPSSAKDIVAFRLAPEQLGDAVINASAGTVEVNMPLLSDLSAIVPQTFQISEGATIEPGVEVARDFSNETLLYVITAEDGSTKDWAITVNQVDPNLTFTDYQAEDAQFTGKIDNQHAGYTGSGFVDFLSGGENYIAFTVCQQEAGTQAAKFRYSLGKEEERPGNLYVNEVFVQSVAFPPTATFTEWAEVEVQVNLNAGLNNVKLTWDETDGPNLDKLSLSGAPCVSYALQINTTNQGEVIISPERANHLYFAGETVTLLAEEKPALAFASWLGDVTGTDNPIELVMDGNKIVTANFTVIPTFTLQVNVDGIGNVSLDPAGGEYPQGTVVTLTANTTLGSTFSGWSGVLSGSNAVEIITMDANKVVTASFSSDISIDFETPIGFASVVTGSGTYNYTTATFFGPTTGAQNAPDTLWVNGAGDFDKLAKHLYDRMRAYKNSSQKWGSNAVKAPLVIVFKEGVYPEGTTAESSVWGNSMMTIQEQGDLTIIGEKNVVLQWGFNVKRSWNILFRNLTFYDYYDDGINIGETETHHIWVDHCTFGHPDTMPTDPNRPDGGVDIKGGASYVTVSWSTFRNSWKTNLIGHSDSNEAEDLGRLKVTLFANQYTGTNSRNPRVRFGEVHVLNNYNENINLYGIAASNKSQVYAENNFYRNSRWPMYGDRNLTDFRAVYGNNTDNVFTSKTGNRDATGLKAVGNAFDDSGLPVITAQINPAMLNEGGRSVKFDQMNPEQVFDPSSYYSYVAFPADVVPTIVPLFAGADKVDFFVPEVFDGTIAVQGTPTPFEQTLGAPSEVQTYTVSATTVSSHLTITPPAGFEVSADGGTTWFGNEAPLTVAANEGTVAETTISVRLNAGEAGAFEGAIVHAAAGAATVQLLVEGVAVPEVAPGNWIIYHANEVPTAFNPDFVVSGTFRAQDHEILADPEKEGNNLLRMNINGPVEAGAPSSFLWRMNFVRHNVELNELTVVLRAKGNPERDLAMDMDLEFAGHRARISFHNLYINAEEEQFPNRARVRNGTGSDADLGVDLSQWNTYRFTMTTTEVKLFVNESTTPVMVVTPQNTGSGNRHFRFGDGDSGNTMGADVDWVTWDYTGAFNPEEAPLPAELTGDNGGGGPDPEVPEGDWTVYEANELPNDFATSPFSAASATGTHANTIVADPAKAGNNLLHISTADNGSNFLWRQNHPTGPNPEASTIVVRAKAKDGTAANMLFELDLDYGGTRQRLMILNNGNWRREFPGPSATGSMGNVNTAEWNMYRITKAADGTVKLFVNEATTPVFEGITAQSSTNNHFRIGDGWGSAFIDTEIDWIIWDVNGAFSPEQTSVPAYLLEEGEEPTDPDPLITVGYALSAFSQTVGTPSTAQTYTLAATDLISAVTITPPVGYEVSADAGVNWFTQATPLVVNPTNGALAELAISVRLNAANAGTVSGNIAHTATNATTVHVPVTGTASAPLAPAITLTGGLTTFLQSIGAPSNVQTYQVSGVDLSEGITITPPNGFEVSANAGASWFTATNPLVVTATSGATNATISVRLNATQAGPYSGTITHTSAGATTRTITANGLAELVLSVDGEGSRWVRVSPNPTSDRMVVHHPAASFTHMALFNSMGAEVIRVAVEPNSESTLLNLGHLPAGMYLLQYQDGERKIQLKVLKK